MLALGMSLAAVAAASAPAEQPAADLITRNFGADAAAAFALAIKADAACGAEKAPCFSLSQAGGKV